MISIVFSLCLLSDPGKCHEERLSYSEESMSLISCMMRDGQMAIAEAMMVRPRWHVEHWHCEPAGMTAKL